MYHFCANALIRGWMHKNGNCILHPPEECSTFQSSYNQTGRGVAPPPVSLHSIIISQNKCVQDTHAPRYGGAFKHVVSWIHKCPVNVPPLRGDSISRAASVCILTLPYLIYFRREIRLLKNGKNRAKNYDLSSNNENPINLIRSYQGGHSLSIWTKDWHRPALCPIMESENCEKTGKAQLYVLASNVKMWKGNTGKPSYNMSYHQTGKMTGNDQLYVLSSDFENYLLKKTKDWSHNLLLCFFYPITTFTFQPHKLLTPRVPHVSVRIGDSDHGWNERHHGWAPPRSRINYEHFIDINYLSSVHGLTNYTYTKTRPGN